MRCFVSSLRGSRRVTSSDVRQWRCESGNGKDQSKSDLGSGRHYGDKGGLREKVARRRGELRWCVERREKKGLIREEVVKSSKINKLSKQRPY